MAEWDEPIDDSLLDRLEAKEFKGKILQKKARKKRRILRKKHVEKSI